MSKLNLKLKENSEKESNVTPIRKSLDGPVVDSEDWLTPLAPGTEFVVSPSYYPNKYMESVFLDFYRKVCNYTSCVYLMEEQSGDEIARYVISANFCKRYSLVEILYKDE